MEFSTSDARCPRCGEKMIPVLDPDCARPTSGPLLADPPVRMRCRACPVAEAPSLAAG